MNFLDNINGGSVSERAKAVAEIAALISRGDAQLRLEDSVDFAIKLLAEAERRTAPGIQHESEKEAFNYEFQARGTGQLFRATGSPDSASAALSLLVMLGFDWDGQLSYDDVVEKAKRTFELVRKWPCEIIDLDVSVIMGEAGKLNDGTLIDREACNDTDGDGDCSTCAKKGGCPFTVSCDPDEGAQARRLLAVSHMATLILEKMEGYLMDDAKSTRRLAASIVDTAKGGATNEN